MHQAAHRGTSSTAIPVGAGSTAAASTTRHTTHARTLSAFADATTTAASTAPAAAAPSGGDDASSEPQPFLKQRRLPSILLDSWEFRKLAAEGSVMANAMVSYDVDDDGVEEVIVGTTEGLLCVVKPDCRAPLFARVLAATISVVLYTPLRRRLVLITLEGQCEVMDYFLSPNRQQPRGYHRSESTSSLSRAGHAGSPNTAGAAAVQQTSQGNLLHNLPRNRSHTSLTHPLLAETVSQQPATPPTHVFHVPSNCLCADLTTDAETDLIFLGSYDRRFYVYSITSGTCLLSLFVHDPITSVKAFTIPTAGAETRRQPTSSSFISVYDKAGRRRQRHHSTTRHDSRPSATTTACNTPGRQTDLYVPLVFIATTTHLILLPAGSNEIQQWRRLQPKTAHLPLTVQLQADAATPQPHQQAPQRTQSPARRTGLSTSASNDPRRASTSTGAGAAASIGEAAGLQRRASCDGGGRGGGAGSGVAPLSNNELRRGRGDGGLATAGAAAANAGTRRSLSEAPEGETPVPPLPRNTRSGNTDNGSHAAMTGGAYGSGAGSRGRSGATAAAALGGGGGDASRPRSNSNGRSGGSGGALQSNAMAAASTRESNSALQADVAGGSNGGAGNSGGGGGGQLTTSQQRRQARKRAIQAAEMGRPVLVKPLWALHINSHTLDVPPLQSLTESFENTAAATTAMSPSGAAAAAAAASEAGKGTSDTYGAKRANVSPLTVSATHDTHHSVSAASHHRHGSRQRRTIPRGDSTSLFSISSPSSVSGLRDNSDVFVERASATQVGGRSLLHRQSVRSSREGGEDTEALAEKAHVLNAAAVAGLATLERSGSGQGRNRSPPQEQQQRVRRQQRRPPRLLRSVNADSISSEEGSLDGVLGEGVGSSASGDDVEGEADAAGEAGSRGRLSSRTRRDFDRAEDFSEGVRFSLPVEGSEPTTLAGRPATAEEEDGGEESSHGSGGGAESEISDDATYDCSTSDSHYDDEDDDDVSEDSYRSHGNNGARRPGAGSAREAKETTPSANAAAVNPSLLARSLARMRAESVPTTLLRRLNAHLTPSAGGANEAGGINAQTSLLDDPVPTRDAPAHGYGSGVHTSLMDLASLDEHGKGHRHHRHHHRRDGDLTDGRHQHHQHGAATGVVVDSLGSEVGDVRLPMSVDVSVGVSQVAVALSCEDGLAMELRFTVARLSSLSRRARHRTGRAVRLYDLRHPPCPFQLTSRAAKHKGEGRQRRADVWSRPPRQDQQQQQSQPHQPASSPSSPTRPRSFSRLDDLARLRTSHMKGGRGGGSRRPTSLILLPQPIPGPHCTGASSSPLPQAAATTGGTARQAGGAAFQTAAASSSFSVASSSSPAGAQVTGAKTSASGVVTGSERGVRRRGQSPQQQQQQRNNGLRTPSPTSPLASGSVNESARSQRYEEEAVVLRAQCLWAARLGDSPLVQRARVFCVRDRHQQNTFCTVFVAANGTCYAIDGDTLSLVECSVKEDCSSFTLMAGPSSTMPLLGYDLMTAGAADGSGEALTGREPAAASPSPSSPRAGVNANLLRGAVGRTVSCVCVSVDELCIYSVGEANQLVQHRDAPHAAHLTATSTATVVTPTETTSLLSRRPPNNPCTSKTTMKRKAPARSDGEKASETRSGWWDEGLDDGLPAVEAEERELLRQLAQRLMEHEGKDQESSTESEEATLLRVRQLLLHGYSDAEWDKMRWLDSGVT